MKKLVMRITQWHYYRIKMKKLLLSLIVLATLLLTSCATNDISKSVQVAYNGTLVTASAKVTSADFDDVSDIIFGHVDEYTLDQQAEIKAAARELEYIKNEFELYTIDAIESYSILLNLDKFRERYAEISTNYMIIKNIVVLYDKDWNPDEIKTLKRFDLAAQVLHKQYFIVEKEVVDVKSIGSNDNVDVSVYMTNALSILSALGKLAILI